MCFIAGALELEGRCPYEHDLLHTYLRTLKKAGGPSLSIDEIWDNYRRHQLHGFLWALTPFKMQGEGAGHGKTPCRNMPGSFDIGVTGEWIVIGITECTR